MTQPLADRPVREALLDAAYDAAVTTGWARARMADVAAAAGVSRQTLYDQFGSREGLAQQLALRELARFLDGTEAAMSRHDDDIMAATEAAVGFVLRAAEDNPLVRAALVETGEDGLLPFITTRGKPVLDAACARLVAYYAEHWPAVPREEAEQASEIATRLTLSYITLPGDTIEATARRIAVLVGRLIDLDIRSVP